jgi:hypothetical protein
VETLGITLTRHARKIPDLRSIHAQQQLLAVLQHLENRKKPIKEMCQLAGFASKVAWMNAIKDELFVAKVEALGVSIRKPHLASHRCQWNQPLISRKNWQRMSGIFDGSNLSIPSIEHLLNM